MVSGNKTTDRCLLVCYCTPVSVSQQEMLLTTFRMTKSLPAKKTVLSFNNVPTSEAKNSSWNHVANGG